MSETGFDIKEEPFEAVLIPETENGFESEKAVHCICVEGHRYVFALPKDLSVKRFRLKLGSAALWCIIDRIEADDKVSAVPEMPYLEVGLKDVFNSADPAYIIESPCFDCISEITFVMRGAYLNAVSDAALFRRLAREKAADRARNRSKERWLGDQIELLEGRLKEAQEAKEEAAEEPEALEKKPGMLRKLKGRLFKTETPEPEPEPEAPEPLRNNVAYVGDTLAAVDAFRCKKNEFYASGWVFDVANAMKNHRLAFYEGTEKKAQVNCPKRPRPDVAEVLGIDDAADCGFEVNISYSSNVPLDVYLEYTTVKGTGGIFLGSLEATPGVDGVAVGKGGTDSLVNVADIIRETGIPRSQAGRYIRSNEIIDIIVPVYNGYEYFEGLFPSIEKTSLKYRLILIYDCGNDERVLPFLKKYADEHDNVVLLENEKNSGFVVSTNKGLRMAIEAGHNAVFLNTDVELPWFWLERLMQPIFEDETVATTTPFTNSGAICSFPEFRNDNKLFAGLKLWEVDDVFNQLEPEYPEMPTGVGFCMGVNIRALEKIGVLDEEVFGKGYGEENDWCRRAMKEGFRNIHVDNLFVYHKHGGSFPSEEKKRLMKEHLDILNEKHPEYSTEVQEYIISDPAKNVRVYAENKMLAMTDNYTILAFDHNIGGGATSYLEKKKDEALKEGKRFVTVRYDAPSRLYITEQYFDIYSTGYSSAYAAEACDLAGRIDEIWINELVTYPDLYNMMEFIKDLKRDNHAKLIMKMHDFFAICPAVTLLDSNNKYCGIRRAEECDKCLPENIHNVSTEPTGTAIWRDNWRAFLECCDVIECFSQSTADLLALVYPVSGSIRLIPHEVSGIDRVQKDKKTTETLNIGVIGSIGIPKGFEVLEGLAKYITSAGRRARIVQFGITCREPEDPAFISLGRYERDDLPELLANNDVDMIFIPSIWPETFSYTTSEAISMGLPLAVFDIGAPPERVRNYDKGLVLPLDTPYDKMLDEFEKLTGVSS